MSRPETRCRPCAQQRMRNACTCMLFACGDPAVRCRPKVIDGVVVTLSRRPVPVPRSPSLSPLLFPTPSITVSASFAPLSRQFGSAAGDDRNRDNRRRAAKPSELRPVETARNDDHEADHQVQQVYGRLINFR